MDAQGLLPERLIWESEARTVDIFKAIGLRLAWKANRRSDQRQCPRVITLAIGASAPDWLPPRALAYAHLPTAKIMVFYDRIEPKIQVWPDVAPALLSHVFAHEIAHVLESLDRHSDRGILKATWTGSDFLLMMNQRLAFSPLDTDLIRAGAARPCRNTGGTD